MENRTCTVEDCSTKRHTKHWCLKHYRRWKKSGTTDAPRRPSLADRFWEKVDKSNDCWRWTGYVGPNGYGMLTVTGSTPTPAHRVSYALNFGAIPEGFDIDHRCHVKACVNPAHLQAVAHRRNGENRLGAQSNSSTGIRGVSLDKRGKYAVSAKVAGKTFHGGRFDTLDEAEQAAIALRLRVMTNNLIDRYSVAG